MNKLLKHRPVVFFNGYDSYLLASGEKGCGNFEKIGKEDISLSINELNGYDEMRLSALVSVSSKSPFINKGDRYNMGTEGKNHQKSGFIVGQVGARFEKQGFMDCQDCLIYPKQNIPANGYGPDSTESRSNFLLSWAKMWGLSNNFPVYDESLKSDESYKLLSIVKDTFLNKAVYKARIRMLADVLLLEASTRATQTNELAYVHIVGLGLGVWEIDTTQHSLYVDAWIDSLRGLPKSATSHLHTLNFSWINKKLIENLADDNKCLKTGVTIVFSRRNLHDPVPDGCFLICNYAWDSNSAPGTLFIF